MVLVVVTVFEAAGLTVSGKRTKTLLRTPYQTTLAPPLVFEVPGQRYKQTARFFYLGGIIHDTTALLLGIDRQICLMRACLNRFGPKLCDRTTALLSLKVRMLKTEVLLYGCVTWTLRAKHSAKL